MANLQMTLFYAVTHSFQLFPETYECPEELKQKRFKRPILGAYFLASGVILIALYIPCIIVIIRTKCRVAAFQLMLILAILDVLSLFVNSVTTGIFDLLGASFCHYPLFTFIVGSIGLASWMSGCVACIL
uniref:Uncharacterized protein n=1 Tax=Caenorhabditis japonica TaxID=281687 RepID=A0A8R1I9T0_CAEJA